MSSTPNIKTQPTKTCFKEGEGREGGSPGRISNCALSSHDAMACKNPALLLAKQTTKRTRPSTYVTRQVIPRESYLTQLGARRLVRSKWRGWQGFCAFHSWRCWIRVDAKICSTSTEVFFFFFFVFLTPYCGVWRGEINAPSFYKRKWIPKTLTD